MNKDDMRLQIAKVVNHHAAIEYELKAFEAVTTFIAPPGKVIDAAEFKNMV